MVLDLRRRQEDAGQASSLALASLASMVFLQDLCGYVWIEDLRDSVQSQVCNYDDAGITVWSVGLPV